MSKVYKLNILNCDGEKVGREVDFSKLNDVEVKNHSIYLSTKSYLAHQRQGTHKTKERSEVNGATRKLKKQKGTGGARQGDVNSPLLRGGGRVFGPKPHEYNLKVNKKERKYAFISVLKNKIDNNALAIVDNFNFTNHKTKNFITQTKGLNLDSRNNLIVTKEKNNTLLLSSRNLNNVTVKRCADLNIYDLLKSNKIYISEDSVEILNNKINEIVLNNKTN